MYHNYIMSMIMYLFTLQKQLYIYFLVIIMLLLPHDNNHGAKQFIVDSNIL